MKGLTYAAVATVLLCCSTTSRSVQHPTVLSVSECDQLVGLLEESKTAIANKVELLKAKTFDELYLIVRKITLSKASVRQSTAAEDLVQSVAMGIWNTLNREPKVVVDLKTLDAEIEAEIEFQKLADKIRRGVDPEAGAEQILKYVRSTYSKTASDLDLLGEAEDRLMEASFYLLNELLHREIHSSRHFRALGRSIVKGRTISANKSVLGQKLQRRFHSRDEEFPDGHDNVLARTETSNTNVGQSPETSMIESEERRTIEVALSSLPPDTAQVMRLRYIQDMSRQEISDTLGIPIKSVKHHLDLGNPILRERLDFKYSLWQTTTLLRSQLIWLVKEKPELFSELLTVLTPTERKVLILVFQEGMKLTRIPRELVKSPAPAFDKAKPKIREFFRVKNLIKIFPDDLAEEAVARGRVRQTNNLSAINLAVEKNPRRVYQAIFHIYLPDQTLSQRVQQVAMLRIFGENPLKPDGTMNRTPLSRDAVAQKLQIMKSMVTSDAEIAYKQMLDILEGPDPLPSVPKRVHLTKPGEDDVFRLPDEIQKQFHHTYQRSESIIQALPAYTRVAARLFYLDGLLFEEVAKSLPHVERRTLRNYLFTAKKEIKRITQEGSPES